MPFGVLAVQLIVVVFLRVLCVLRVEAFLGALGGEALLPLHLTHRL
jgi:hypothetical protein